MSEFISHSIIEGSRRFYRLYTSKNPLFTRLLLLGCFSYQKIKQGVLCVFRFMGLCTFSTKTRILYNSETLYLSMVVFHEMKKHALKNFY